MTTLPALGSPTFVPALLAHLQTEIDQGGETWSIDPSLFSTLLLSQVVGPRKGGVIVDVLRDESGNKGIGRVVENVVALTQGVFGLSTGTLRLSSSSDPSDLPYDLFANPDPSWPKPRVPRRGSSRPSARNQSMSQTRISTSPSSSRYTSALPSPFFPRSVRASRTTTPGITPKNSTPLFSAGLFGPLLIPGEDDHVDRSADGGHEEPRLPQCLVITGLERAESSVWTKLVDILLKGYVETDSVPEKPQPPPRADVEHPSSSSGDGLAGREATHGTQRRRWKLADDFWLIWVRAEEQSEKCPSWLIDRFSCSVCVRPGDLDRPPDLPLRAIIPQMYISDLKSLLAFTHIHPPLQTHTSNILSALSAHPRLSAAITGQAMRTFPEFIRAHRLLSAPFTLPPGWKEGLLFRRGVMDGSKAADLGVSGARMGVGGGLGGVNSWGIIAGEEPDLASLTGGGSQATQCDIDADDQAGCQEEEWYVHPTNVDAIAHLALRHRLAWKAERKGVMWLLAGSARSHLDRSVNQACIGFAADGEVERLGKLGTDERGRDEADLLADRKEEKSRARRRRREVDMILERVLVEV